MNGIFLTTTFQWDWKCCLCICTTWDLTAFAILCIPDILEENLRCGGVCRRRWPSCFIQEWEWDEVGEAQDGRSSLLVLMSYLPWSFFWVLIINCNTEMSWETSTYLPIHSPNFRASLLAFRSWTIYPTMAFSPAEGDSSPLGDYNCRVTEYQCWEQSQRSSGPSLSFLTEEESEA